MNTYLKYTVAVVGGLLLSCNNIVGQVVKTDYFMKSSITRNSMNPALTPEQGFLIAPVIPTVGVGVETNTLVLDNLMFSKGGEMLTFMHKDVTADEFLKNIKSDNFVGVNANTKLFSLGFYKGDSFWNVDLGLRVHTDVSLPKSLFELLKVGFNQTGSSIYDLSEIDANVSSFAEIGVSHARPFLDNKLVLGGRVKLLAGLAHADLSANSLSIEAGETQWKALSEVSLKGAAPGVTPTYDKEGYFDGFDFDWGGIPGWGVGFDLGAVYDMGGVLPVLDGLKVSAALNDIGYIKWNKKNTIALKSDKSEVIVDLNRNNKNGTSLESILEDAVDDLKDAVNLKEDPKGSDSYSTGLRTTLNIGAEYEVVKEKVSVGALFSNYYGNFYNQTELTFSGNYRPCSWFATALSYSALSSSFDNFGLAVHFIPKKGLNLFLSGDYVIARVSPQYIPTSSKGANVQVGVSVPLGSRH